jgi:hypothetical protein
VFRGPNADWVTQLYLPVNVMHIPHELGRLESGALAK